MASPASDATARCAGSYVTRRVNVWAGAPPTALTALNVSTKLCPAAALAGTPDTVAGFGGFIAPKDGSTLKKSAAAITVRFRLTTAAGAPIPGSVAAALAKANDVRVTLRGPGIAPVTADCAWAAGAKVFQCAVATPKGIKTGKASPYTITAYENTGPGFSTAPVSGPAVSPETVYFE